MQVGLEVRKLGNTLVHIWDTKNEKLDMFFLRVGVNSIYARYEMSILI